MSNGLLKLILVLMIVLFGMTGCATKVATIVQDKTAYRDKSFSPQTLPPDLVKTVTEKPVSLPFRNLSVKITSTVTTVGQAQPESDIGELDFFNAGNGFIEETKDWSHNDIPYALDYNLGYVGIFTFKVQNVWYKLQNAFAPVEVGKIIAFPNDIAQPKESAVYVYEEQESNPTPGTFLPYDYSTQCHAGEKFYPANTILPVLTGNAIDLDCVVSRDKIVQNKMKMVFLTEYGIYIPLEASNSTQDLEL